MEINDVSGLIVDAAVNVHKKLGPGLLESLYEEALCYELDKRELFFERQKQLQVPYDDIFLQADFRLDLVVDDRIVVELKTVEKILPIHEAQLLTYLKITNAKLGLLLNFNSFLMKDGIRRIIL